MIKKDFLKFFPKKLMILFRQAGCGDSSEVVHEVTTHLGGNPMNHHHRCKRTTTTDLVGRTIERAWS